MVLVWLIILASSIYYLIYRPDFLISRICLIVGYPSPQVLEELKIWALGLQKPTKRNINKHEVMILWRKSNDRV